MEKKNKLNSGSDLRGFFLIDKPRNITSFDVIRKLRKIIGFKKMGHTGTLDPFASGLLIVLLGKATKLSDKFLKLDKEYETTVRLGAISNTYDSEGQIKNIVGKTNLKKDDIENALKNFRGKIKQVPPKFSAVKIKGKKAYELARSGKDFEIEPKEVKIHESEILEYSWPILKIKVSCSCGTYIRSLANDVGKVLKTGAYLEELRRTKIGEFDIKNAVELEKLTNKNWQDYLVQKDPLEERKNHDLKFL